MEIDLEELAAMVEMLKAADFTEFRYEKGDLRIQIRRGAAGGDDAWEAAPAGRATGRQDPSPTPVKPAQRAPVVPEGARTVAAPLLGTFYARPKPGEAAFVQVGDRVEPDTVLCIVEVMKLMNSVHAECAGVVVAAHAADGELVEFGQPLFSIAEGQG